MQLENALQTYTASVLGAVAPMALAAAVGLACILLVFGVLRR